MTAIGVFLLSAEGRWVNLLLILGATLLSFLALPLADIVRPESETSCQVIRGASLGLYISVCAWSLASLWAL